MIIYGFYEGKSLLSRIIRWQTHSYISHVSVMHMHDSVYDYRTDTLNWHRLVREKSECRLWEAWKDGIIRRTGMHDGHTPGTPLHLMRLATAALNRQVDEPAMIRYMDQCVADGIKYDWIGLLRYRLRINRNNDARLFCSEFAHNAALEGAQPLLRRVLSSHFVAPADQYHTPILETMCTVKT